MTAGTGDLVVMGIGQLVGLDGRRGPIVHHPGPLDVVEDAAVWIRGGSVQAAGPARDVLRALPSAAAVEVLDAGGRCVVPGLVDSNSHLLYAERRTDEHWRRASGQSVEDVARSGGGLQRSVRAARAVGSGRLLATLLERLDEAIRHGTTTVEVKTGIGLETAAEEAHLAVLAAAAAAHPIGLVRTFFGAHGVPTAHADDPESYIDEVVEDMLPRAAALADACDVLCDPLGFKPGQARRVLRAARRHGLTPRMMADETGDIGAAGVAAAERVTAVSHLNHADPRSFAALAAAGVVAIVMPTTALMRLTSRPPDVRAMLEAGVPVALGTDHRPTAPQRSQLAVLALACGELGVPVEAALVACTVNGAWACARGDQVGCLAAGYSGDMVIVDVEDYRELAAYLEGAPVWHVVRQGRLATAAMPQS